ncbi:MAG: NHLP leader peptide family natural product precursor [Syntrophomonadaceae bacterium]|nr:NHLP leader peptide family natural product precursor [Syntrophomonadaceae bacterium]
MDTKNLTTLELNQLIADKARENDDFRLALINDAKTAIKKEFAVEFPEDTKVEVHVESTKVLHLIIPAGNADELTDDQLEDVAGGTALQPGVIICAYGVPYPGGGTAWKWPAK